MRLLAGFMACSPFSEVRGRFKAYISNIVSVLLELRQLLWTDNRHDESTRSPLSESRYVGREKAQSINGKGIKSKETGADDVHELQQLGFSRDEMRRERL